MYEPHEISAILAASGTGIRFEEPSHTYYAGKSITIPSVTEIIKIYRRMDGSEANAAHPAVRLKSLIGKTVHEASELWDVGKEADIEEIAMSVLKRFDTTGEFQDEFDTICNRSAAYLESYIEWAEFYAPQWLLLEQVVGSSLGKRPYAGTLDRFGVIRGTPVVCDIKTSLKMSHGDIVQAAGYALAAGSAVPLIGLAVVYLKDNGKPGNLVFVEPARASVYRRIFNCCRNLWYAAREIEQHV